MDATSLDMLQLCPARFNYRFNLNKDSTAKARQLDRGTVVHVGLEKYYTALKNGDKYTDAVDMMLASARLALVESELDESENRPILHTLEECVDHWRVEDQGFIINEVEKAFSYVLHEDEDIRVIMTGKIDLLTTDHQYTNRPMDHKSYDREFPVRRLSNQFMNYCYATGSNYLVVNKVGFQKTLKAVDKYKRIPVSYDPLILEEWKQNVIKWMLSYLSFAAEGIWPMNFTSCDKFNRPCSYLEICESSGAEAKLFKLESSLKTVEAWDVSAVLKK